uniref:Uncharacterized protein n=1 Tax=Oryza meridionalis TaxID=40149 RepID=A0A0E0DFI5_9ORYZ
MPHRLRPLGRTPFRRRLGDERPPWRASLSEPGACAHRRPTCRPTSVSQD